jgi:hypothetical protein
MNLFRLIAFTAILSVAADSALIATGSRAGILPGDLVWVYWIFAGSLVWSGFSILLRGTEQ